MMAHLFRGGGDGGSDGEYWEVRCRWLPSDYDRMVDNGDFGEDKWGVDKDDKVDEGAVL
jgi:hypothetical protein